MSVPHVNPETRIFEPGDLPPPKKLLRVGLALHKIPGLIRLGKRIVLLGLPHCRNVHMEPGFRALQGNVYAEDVYFHDAFLQDYADIIIGSGTGFSYDNMIITASHDVEGVFGRVIARPVVIGKEVWITSRVTILGGSKIGDGAVIGAGSVVTGEIPPCVFAAGVPARPIKTLRRPGYFGAVDAGLQG